MANKIPTSEELHQAFGGAFAMSGAYLTVDWTKVEVMPGYNAKRPFDIKSAYGAKLYGMIEHNGWDETLPITVGVDIVKKKIWLLRGHSRLAIAAIQKQRNSAKTPHRIACQIVDAETFNDPARRALDVNASNTVRNQDDAETGMTIARLLATGITKSEVQARLGIDRKKYAACVAAADADPEIITLMKADLVAPSFVNRLRATHGKKKAETIVKTTRAKKLAAGDKSKVTPGDAAPVEAALTGTTKVTDTYKTTGAKRGRKAGQKQGARGPNVAVLPAVVKSDAPVEHAIPVSLSGPWFVGPANELWDHTKLAIGYMTDGVWARGLVDLLNAVHRAGYSVVKGDVMLAGKLVKAPMAETTSGNVTQLRAAAAKQAAPRKQGKPVKAR